MRYSLLSQRPLRGQPPLPLPLRDLSYGICYTVRLCGAPWLHLVPLVSNPRCLPSLNHYNHTRSCMKGLQHEEGWEPLVLNLPYFQLKRTFSKNAVLTIHIYKSLDFGCEIVEWWRPPSLTTVTWWKERADRVAVFSFPYMHCGTHTHATTYTNK